jgi:phosphatidylglycerophosphate synthase
VSVRVSGVASTVPAAAQFRALARADAGLFTQVVNYPVAASLGVLAYRARLRPTALTLANLVLGLAASVLVVAAATQVAARPGVAAVVGLVAWTLWQVAYCIDCADGQLARVTSATSAAGGRLDILCDIAVQISVVAAVASVATEATATRPGIPSWLVAVFAGTWMVNLVTSVMAKEGTNTSLITSGSLVVRLVKLIRDYGFIVTAIAGVIAVHPPSMVWVMVLFCVINGGFLLASIGQSSRRSLRGPTA